MKHIIMTWILLFSQVSYANLTTSQSMGMSGTGVANTKLSSAALLNPAIIALNYQQEKVGIDFFSLSFKSYYFIQTLADANDFIDKLEALEGDHTNTDLQKDFAESVITLQKDTFSHASFNVHFGFAAQTKVISLGFYLQNTTRVNTFNDFDPDELANPPTPNTNNKIELDSQVIVLYDAVDEYTLTLANPFTNLSKKLFLGLNLKFQRIAFYGFNSILTTDTSLTDIGDDPGGFLKSRLEEANIKKAFNVDLGVVYNVQPKFQIGFMLRNAIPRSYKIKTNGTPTVEYKINPVLTGGISYVHGIVTYNFDLDANPKKNYEKFKNTNSTIKSNMDNEQFARLGVEANFRDALFVRSGYSINFIAPTLKKSMVSLGIGIIPNNFFNIDIGMEVRNQHNFAASFTLSGNL